MSVRGVVKEGLIKQAKLSCRLCSVHADLIAPETFIKFQIISKYFGKREKDRWNSLIEEGKRFRLS